MTLEEAKQRALELHESAERERVEFAAREAARTACAECDALRAQAQEWKAACARAGYSNLLTPSGLETVLGDLQRNVRGQIAEGQRLGQIIQEKDQHLDSTRERLAHAEGLVAVLTKQTTYPDDPARAVAAMLGRMNAEDKQAFNFCVKSAERGNRDAERLDLLHLSDLLTDGTAGTWAEVFHAADTARRDLAESRQREQDTWERVKQLEHVEIPGLRRERDAALEHLRGHVTHGGCSGCRDLLARLTSAPAEPKEQG